jgi:hypothetical protein
MRTRMTPGIANMRVQKKNVLYSSSALLDQRSLQLINTFLINCKNRWSNKAELEGSKSLIHFF